MVSAALNDPEVLLDPYPALAWLQKHDPVHWANEVQCWVVTQYQDVVNCFRDPRLSANRVHVMAHVVMQGADTAPIKDYLQSTDDMMLMKDGQEHHRLRVLGNRGFAPSALKTWAPRVDRVIDELLDQAATDGRMDLVADLAEPMPATVIAEMFGIPKEDHKRFRTWADDSARFFGGTVQNALADGIAANTASLELDGYFRTLYQQRQQQPGDDLMSMFVAAEEAGRLSVDEVVRQCSMILIAGHVTTIDQLANGVYALLRHEGQYERLVQQPELLRSAVEEMIRYDSSVTLVMRVAMEDIVLHDREIKAGQLVFLALAAANRDPDVFEQPTTFDITRSPNKHIGFGAGQHQCLGMNLARMELEAALRGLVARFPKLRLDPERLPIRKIESLTFRGFARLPLRTD